MVARGDAEALGYSREPISFAVVLSPAGEPVEVKDLRINTGNKPRPARYEVPMAAKRTFAIHPNIFWDKTAYSLGVTRGSKERTANEHAAFRNVHLHLLRGATDKALVALRRFLKLWHPARYEELPFSDDMVDTNIVFAVLGESGFLHERPAARKLFASQIQPELASAQCLVTGKQARIRRLHPAIKGVDGAQTSGATLVSFEQDSFNSLGKSRGENAPTSDAAAFGYGAALNRLLDRATSRNRTRIGDMTLIFWADVNKSGNEMVAVKAESLFADAIDSTYFSRLGESDELNSSPADLGNLTGDQPIGTFSSGVVRDLRFYVLGLSPNVARLSVRLWLEERVGVFVDRIAQHYEHLALEPCPWGGKLPSLQRLLDHATVAVESIESVSPMLAAELTRAVLNGDRYPLALLYAAITRLRAGDDPGRGWHASVIKAVINRSGNAPLPVALDLQHKNTPYQIGRLLAVAEKTQREAFGYHIKSTIVNRYYPLASVRPSRTLLLLQKKMQMHKLIAQSAGRADWVDKRVAEIEKYLPPILPDMLSLEDQGRVAVGYYHERTARNYTN